jgi:tetratricopeptide (TPR) repeat protein
MLILAKQILLADESSALLITTKFYTRALHNEGFADVSNQGIPGMFNQLSAIAVGHYRTANYITIHSPAPLPRPFSPQSRLGSLPIQNMSFTGRVDQLAEIARSLSQAQQVVVTQSVMGLGGVGKTQLVTEYVHQSIASNKYAFIAWLDGTQPEHAYRSLGECLGLVFQPTDVDVQDIIAKVEQRLIAHYPSLLLVWDDAKDEAQIHPYLASAARLKAHCLITSRAQNWSEDTSLTMIRLDVYSEAEALIFLHQRFATSVGLYDEVAAKNLANTVGYLPLALAQAAAYILRQRQMYRRTYSLNDYLSAYNTLQVVTKKEFFNTVLPSVQDNYSKTVWTTWYLSIVALRAENPQSVSLIEYCAYLGEQEVQDRLLSLLSAIPEDEVRHSIDALLAYSLVERRMDNHLPAIKIHQLLQTVIRLHLQQESLPSSMPLSLPELEQAAQEEGPIPEALMMRRYLTDKTSQWQWNQREEALNYPPLSTGELTAARAQKESPIKALRKLVIPAIHNNRNHQIIALLLKQLEQTFYYDERQKEHLRAAQVLFASHVKAVCDHALTAEIGEPDVVRLLHHLGGLTYYLKDAKEMREIFYQIWPYYEDFYSNHPLLGKVLNNLATAYDDLGDFQSAQNTYHRALRIKQHFFGEAHLEVGLVLFNLARLHFKQDEFSLSFLYLKKAHAIFLHHPNGGLSHPYTQKAIELLNQLAPFASMLEATAQQYTHSLQIDEQAFQDYTTAIQYWQIALPFVTAQSFLFSAHKFDAILLHERLGDAYREQGEYVRAMANYTQAQTQLTYLTMQQSADYLRIESKKSSYEETTELTQKTKECIDLCNEKLTDCPSQAPAAITSNPQKPSNNMMEVYARTTAIAPRQERALPQFSTGHKMISHSTKGGGDCAFHAALGAWNAAIGKFETDNIAEKRNRVAAAILTCRDNFILFPLVVDAIRELVMSTQTFNGKSLRLLRNAYNRHISDSDKRDAELQAAIKKELSHNTEIRQRINQYTEQYIQNKKLDERRAKQLRLNLYAQFCIYEADNQDEDSISNLIKTPSFKVLYDAYKTPALEFPWNKRCEDLAVLSEYAEFFSQVGQHLLPSELNIIAHVFDIHIVYYACNTANPEDINPKGSNEVWILFNGINHYERVTAEHSSSHIVPKAKEHLTLRREKLANSTTYTPAITLSHPGSIMPKPYEYALISQAIYSDSLSTEGSNRPIPEVQRKLHNRGWRLLALVTPASGYRGGIWVHEASKEMVLAHRGYPNIKSWLKDLETVYCNQGGAFAIEAIALLKHPEVVGYRQSGYRLSTTGHSLGGFLAQVCLYFANRDDSPETYYPEMRAYVFDSPGAYDFLKLIGSNLAAERARIDLDKLNVHNFCAEPTVVSTYGKQVGTLWHVCAPKGAKTIFDFVNAHKMYIILSRFDEDTGIPKKGLQMAEWPKADYSEVDLSQLNVGNETLWLAFYAVNWLYKNIILKAAGFQPETPSWYNQLREHPGQVQASLTAKELEKDCATIIKNHYKPRPAISLPIFHFPIKIQELLISIKEITAGEAARVERYWDQFKSERISDEDIKLLSNFDLKVYGNIKTLELHSDYQINIFEYQQKLITFLSNTDKCRVILAKIKELQPQEATSTFPREYCEYIANAVANAEYALAIKVMSQSEREAYARDIDNRIATAIHLKEEGYDKVSLYHASAVANRPGSVALQMLDEVKDGPTYYMVERARRDAQSAAVLASRGMLSRPHMDLAQHLTRVEEWPSGPK